MRKKRPNHLFFCFLKDWDSGKRRGVFEEKSPTSGLARLVEGHLDFLMKKSSFESLCPTPFRSSATRYEFIGF